ncbi:bi-domain-containing oxidoreductase [Roseivirga sp. E12]|uniref:bi-domain-containing oxidoreductase n=1 Tax=Roseivirga sp. E12 TaxID=2819237 RepID=UPI001ABCDC3A|nr:bi-domain-containing oxidoreductase [Roseivirga sp. E12]MBO3699745.1 bi-domain-containing oxidoreductase [Roseivirga sp. E12]
MKQIIQDLKSGETILEEVPAPVVRSGSVLIKTTKSLVSLGTERMLVEFGKANLIAKARQQPDKVKMVLDKIKTDGLMPTLETVFNKLNQPLPLGYCNVGEVVAVGRGVKEFKVGDRVASNGNHAEYVCIPENLVANIPDQVSDSEAAFTVIGAIGLQSIRLFNPTMGEKVVVIGLGLIGLITAELLMANGCDVIGFDFDQTKVGLAKKKGVHAVNLAKGGDPVKITADLTNDVGADGVIITASNKSNDIISNAANMCRKRGRIILVGVIGLNISRADFYEKELSFQVSCSYGPGRYDDDYEQKGHDYPLPYVRWTEKRNFETVLGAIANKKLDVTPLITEEIPLPDYQKIYADMGASRSIASILSYDDNKNEPLRKVKVNTANGDAGALGVIGAGNFTNAMILPALKKNGVNAKYIASSGGLSAKTLASKFQANYATSDYNEILKDEDVKLVLITTRHNMHASMTLDSLEAGKHVFVEKPLALSLDEIEAISAKAIEKSLSVVVGFNRRFSPHIVKIKKALGENGGSMNIVATMNAGFIPPEVWVHDMKVGGGRIIGEACHYIDLMVYLTGSRVTSVCMNSMGKNPEENTDNASILIKFESGAIGTINYFSNGSKSYSKERIEVYSQERTFICDNFRITKGYGASGFGKLKTKQDKGHVEQFKQLSEFAKNGGSPIIPFDEVINVSKSTILAIESLKSGQWVNVV